MWTRDNCRKIAFCSMPSLWQYVCRCFFMLQIPVHPTPCDRPAVQDRSAFPQKTAHPPQKGEEFACCLAVWKHS